MSILLALPRGDSICVGLHVRITGGVAVAPTWRKTGGTGYAGLRPSVLGVRVISLSQFRHYPLNIRGYDCIVFECSMLAKGNNRTQH